MKHKTILITHPIHQNTLTELNLINQVECALISETVFYGEDKNKQTAIFYIPDIAKKQIFDESQDQTLTTLKNSLMAIKPDVLIVGNNAVNGEAIASWRQAVGDAKPLLIIRRGVDTRAIDKNSATKYGVKIDNLPGINSPYVAKHILNYLNLQKADNNDSVGIIGVGNIGKEIALKAIEYNLKVYLFSPSLQNPDTRMITLKQRNIPAEKVTCVNSLMEIWEQANFITISIPLYDKKGKSHENLMTVEHLNQLDLPARICSVSVPIIFTESALHLMNKLAEIGKLYVRIDTPKRYVEMLKKRYNAIDSAHDQAFADDKCQMELDQAMLNKARLFLTHL